MASVTQNIPTLTLGLSQQPDELKIPGQVNVAENVLPDVAHGLQKRPGGRLVKSLSDGTLNSNDTGKWFHYYRDEAEQYIGQIIRKKNDDGNSHADDGKIRMWRCLDGQEMSVTHDAGTQTYLTHTNDEDVQTLTVNDFTFITNRTQTVTLEQGSELEAVRPPEAFIELKQVAYSKQYSVNLFSNTNTQTTTTATRIEVQRYKSSNNCCHTDGSLRSYANRHTDGNRCTGASSSDNQTKDSYLPNVDTRIFNVGSGSSLTDTDVQNTSYTYSISVNYNNTSGRKNLYFRIRTTGQAIPEGNSSEPQYHGRYTTTHDLLYGGEGWVTGDQFFIWMRGAEYRVTVMAHSTTKEQANLGLVRPDPTPFDTSTTVTATGILGDIRKNILGSSNGGTNSLYQWKDDLANGYEVKQIGNGIYVTRPASQGTFNISTPVGELLNVLSDSVQDVTDLPNVCKHGYVVKVANSESEEDDYYVRFIGHNNQDGDGVWEECLKPGVEKKFTATTMPVQLIRNANNTFTVSTINWDLAEVGDTDPDGTNPQPSFVGSQINQILFFRNRLVMLSEENVIMSRPGDFYNFWCITATTFSATDPIDISISSEYPSNVFDGIQVNSGLVLFTKNQQFLLTTDSDVLSPQTAKINAVASYNFNHKTSPLSLGTTIGFIDNANKFSRFFEMARVLREGEPEVVEQSKVVSNLLNKDLTLVANSRENSVIFFATKGGTKIQGYRYFSSSEKRLMSAWFEWDVVGEIQYICMLDDALYLVYRNNSKDQLLKFPIKIDDNGLFATDTKGTATTEDDVIYRVHLDNAKEVTPTVTYTQATNTSTFTKPDGFERTTDLCVFDADFSNNFGRFAEATVSGSTVSIAGDWTGETFILGYLFDMEVGLPTIFVGRREGEKFRSNTRAYLTIHRINLNFTDLGVYKTTIKRLGKNDYSETYEMTPATQVLANRVAALEEVTKTIPIYERNQNVEITISSKHPLPASLISLSWEGDLNNKFYRSV